METKQYNHLITESKIIRETVFVREQGFKEEFDDIDNSCIHFVCYHDDKAIGTCRVLYSKEHNGYMVGRVAVIKEYRKMGVGKELMKAAENYLHSINVNKVYVSAQKRAIPFYETIGYAPIGDFYLDEHYPHILMYKDI